MKKKKIEHPETLVQHFEDYKVWLTQNPNAARALTMLGFENFLSKQGLISNLKDYFSNREHRYEIFISVCTAIRKEIYVDQVRGGLIQGNVPKCL